MAKRIALLTTLIVSLALLPSCPAGVPSALVGAWVITADGTDSGMQINANGEAVPFMLDIVLSGTWTWEVDGTRVVLHQMNSVNNAVWVAELTSETAMEGAAIVWKGVSLGNSNTFTAVKQ